MLFIKAVTIDNKIEFLNIEKATSIRHLNNGTTKILMSAGLYWEVFTDTIEEVNILNHLQNN